MPGPDDTPQPREAHVLSWDALRSTYLPAMLLALGVGIALPAIPVPARSFDVGFGLASFVITAFLIGGTIGTVPTGWMSVVSVPIGFLAGWWMDRFGRKATMVPGFVGVTVVFTAAAAACITAILLITLIPETSRRDG